MTNEIRDALREEFRLTAAIVLPQLDIPEGEVSFDGQRHWVELQAWVDRAEWIPIAGHVAGFVRLLGGLGALTVGTGVAALVALKYQNWTVVKDIAAFGVKHIVLGARSSVPFGNAIHFAYLMHAYKGQPNAVELVRQHVYSYAPVRSNNPPVHFASHLRSWMDHSATSEDAPPPNLDVVPPSPDAASETQSVVVEEVARVATAAAAAEPEAEAVVVVEEAPAAAEAAAEPEAEAVVVMEEAPVAAEETHSESLAERAQRLIAGAWQGILLRADVFPGGRPAAVATAVAAVAAVALAGVVVARRRRY